MLEGNSIINIRVSFIPTTRQVFQNLSGLFLFVHIYKYSFVFYQEPFSVMSCDLLLFKEKKQKDFHCNRV